MTGPVPTPAPRPFNGGPNMKRLLDSFPQKSGAGGLRMGPNSAELLAAATADVAHFERAAAVRGVVGISELDQAAVEDLAGTMNDGGAFMRDIGAGLLHSRANVEIATRQDALTAKRRAEANASARETLTKIADADAALRRRWASYSDAQLDAYAAKIPRDPSLTRNEKLRELDAVRVEFSARAADRNRPNVVGQGKL